MGLFGGSSNDTCPVTSWEENATENFVGSLSFYHFNVIFSGCCTVFIVIGSFLLMHLHATHFSNPSEQIKIMRICNFLPSYTLFTFLSILFPKAYVDLSGWPDLFEALALYSFFLLLCDFVAPNDKLRAAYFASLQIPSRWKKGQIRDINPLKWLKIRWITILQNPPVTLICAVGIVITQTAGIYCLDSSKPHFAHIWIAIVRNFSVGMAIDSIIQFYMATKTSMKEHKPMMKLLAFKLSVGLVFLEGIIFTILRSTQTLKQTSMLTYADITIGLPDMIICLQMVPFTIFFYFAYGIGPYTVGSKEYHPLIDDQGKRLLQTYQGGFCGYRAWLMLLNPFQIYEETKDFWSMIYEARRLQGDFEMS